MRIVKMRADGAYHAAVGISAMIGAFCRRRLVEERVQTPLRSLRGSGDFEEVEGVLSAEQARLEEERSYGCGKP